MRGLVALLGATMALASGCGGESGDLIAFQVGDRGAGEPFEVVVTEDGRARCEQGGALRAIRNDLLIDAREAERELSVFAEEARRFSGPAPPEARRFVARMRAGTVRWRDGADGNPPELAEAQLLVLRLDDELCGDRSG